MNTPKKDAVSRVGKPPNPKIDLSCRMARSLIENDVRYVLVDKLVIEEFSFDSDFSDAPGFDIFSRGVFEFTDMIKQNGRLIYLTDRFELYRIKNLSAISEEPFS